MGCRVWGVGSPLRSTGRHTDLRHTDLRHTDLRHTDLRHTALRANEKCRCIRHPDRKGRPGVKDRGEWRAASAKTDI